MKKLIGSRKGVDAFTFVLTIIAISALTLILVGLTMKYSKLTNTIGGAGSSASVILSTYDKADSALLYLDNSVGMSMKSAIYGLAYNGFYYGGSRCGSSNGRVLWSRGSAVTDKGSCNVVVDKCVPKVYASPFEKYFTEKLNPYLSAYNKESEVNLPQNDYELSLGRPGELFCSGGGCEGRNDGKFQLVGKADKPVRISNGRLNYSVLPSFRENSDVDLIGDFNEVTARADGFLELIDSLILKIQSSPILSESEIEGILNGYSRAGVGLEWSLEGYDTSKTGSCDTKSPCSVCCRSCEDGGCCSSAPGTTYRVYRNYYLDIGVRMSDEDYATSGKKGYKGFVENGGVPKEYKYRFALHWVSLTPQTYCVPIRPCG